MRNKSFRVNSRLNYQHPLLIKVNMPDIEILAKARFNKDLPEINGTSRNFHKDQGTNRQAEGLFHSTKILH